MPVRVRPSAPLDQLAKKPARAPAFLLHGIASGRTRGTFERSFAGSKVIERAAICRKARLAFRDGSGSSPAIGTTRSINEKAGPSAGFFVAWNCLWPDPRHVRVLVCWIKGHRASRDLPQRPVWRFATAPVRVRPSAPLDQLTKKPARALAFLLHGIASGRTRGTFRALVCWIKGHRASRDLPQRPVWRFATAPVRVRPSAPLDQLTKKPARALAFLYLLQRVLALRSVASTPANTSLNLDDYLTLFAIAGPWPAVREHRQATAPQSPSRRLTGLTRDCYNARLTGGRLARVARTMTT